MFLLKNSGGLHSFMRS